MSLQGKTTSGKPPTKYTLASGWKPPSFNIAKNSPAKHASAAAVEEYPVDFKGGDEDEKRMSENPLNNNPELARRLTSMRQSSMGSRNSFEESLEQNAQKKDSVTTTANEVPEVSDLTADEEVEEHVDAVGTTYFYNRMSGQTAWSKDEVRLFNALVCTNSC